MGALSVQPLAPGAQRLQAVSGLLTDTGLGLEQIYKVTFSPDQDAKILADALAQRPDVYFAEPDYYAYPLAAPNDPLLDQQWGADAVAAQSAWDAGTGNGVVVAVLDSGIDFMHEDLAGRAWQNPGEVPENGLDDDRNGYIDDYNGLALYGSAADISDASGHGTQVAGVLAATGNNGKGIAGMCWGCQIMAVKVLRPDGVANYSDVAAGVLYAAQKGAQVINISLGGSADSATLRSAIATAAKSALIVAGAGNDNREQPFYPAAYPEVVAVAGLNPDHVKTGDSNFGAWVDLAAPGVSVQTLFAGGGYGPASGTSVAAPWVAGTAALIAGQHPDWTAQAVRTQLFNTAASVDAQNPTLVGKLGTGRLLAGPALQTVPQPRYSLAGFSAAGVNNGDLPVGASSELVVTLRNDWAAATDVQLSLSSTSPDAVIEMGQASLGAVPAGGLTSNASAPFKITVAAGKFGLAIPLTLHGSADGAAFEISFTVETEPQAIEVQGKVNTSQTWYANRVYHVINNLIIPSDVTLTVEPGTIVKVAAGKTILVNGTLAANGTPEKRITFTAIDQTEAGRWAGVRFENCVSSTYDENQEYLSGSVVGFSIIQWAGQILNVNGCGLYIHNNLIKHNKGSITSNSSGGNYSTTDNRFEWNEVTETYAHMSTLLTLSGQIKHNLFHNNQGAIVFIYSGQDFRWNTLINNESGITGPSDLISYYGWGGSQNTYFSNNNIITEENRIAIKTVSSSSIDATNNYWGTTTSAEISEKIFDMLDDVNLGEVIFEPYLSVPDPDAPVYVYGLATNPTSPVGIETVTFSITVSGTNIQTSNPQLSFESIKRGKTEIFDETSAGQMYRIVADKAQNVYAVPQFYTPSEPMIMKYDGQAWTKLTPNNSALPNSQLTAIYSDPFGNIWFGNKNGQVIRISKDGSWTVSQVSDWQVYHITTTPDGRGVVLVGNDRGIYIQKGQTWEHIPFIDQSISTYNGLEVDGQGNIWIYREYYQSSQPDNIAMFDGKTWKTISLMGGIQDRQWTVKLMHRDANNRLWVVFRDNPLPVGPTTIRPDKIIRYQNGTWTELSPTEVNNVVFVSAIAEDNNGRLYIKYSEGIEKPQGVLRYDGIRWSKMLSIPGFTYDTFAGKTLAVDGVGNIFVLGNVSQMLSGSLQPKVIVYWGGEVYDDFDSEHWLDDFTLSANYDINMLIPQGLYKVSVTGLTGKSGMTVPIAPDLTFTIAYTGQVSNAGQPRQPMVFATGIPGSPTRVDAQWSGDPGLIYRYAFGTGAGLTDVLSWTETTVKTIGLDLPALVAGRQYWVSVKARNSAGLWSPVGSAEFVAGEQNFWEVYLPGAVR